MMHTTELHEAFLTFDQAAGFLQDTYQRLTDHIRRLDLELKTVNANLTAELQENQSLRQHLERIVESLTVGVLVTDEEGTITVVNRVAEQLIGLPRDSMVGCSLDQIWERSALPPVPFSGIHHQGRVLSCVEGELGAPSQGRIRTLQDMTRITYLQDQLARHNRLAALGEMIGRIAHEIRNPLGSIELFTSLLKDGVRDEEERRTVADHIVTSIRTLDQLLSNLLVVTGPKRPHLQEVEGEQLVREVIPLAMQPLCEHRITLREQVPDHVAPVTVDPSLVRQAFLNILLNAIQASREGGVVDVEMLWTDASSCGPGRPETGQARDYEGVFTLSVTDYGDGIAPEDRAKIFDPFFTKREQGTGLGLAIVHQVMEAHGGWVEIDSEVERGTKVSLCFPQGKVCV